MKDFYMVKSKYKVGDYLRLGIDKYYYYKVIEVTDKYYVLEHNYGNGEFRSKVEIIENPYFTFKKLSKAEVLLYWNGL